MIKHVNNFYKVEADHETEVIHSSNVYVGCYRVVNLDTGITEFRTPALPEAIFIAEDLANAIATEAWNWRKQTQAEKMDVAKSALADKPLN